MNFINYNNLIYLFEQFAANHYQIKRYGNGEIHDIETYIADNGEFPIMWSNLIDVNYQNNDRVKNYSFNILFFDILKNDKSNESEIINDQIQIAEDFIRFINYNQQNTYRLNPDQYPLITPFTERFSEFIAGVNVTVNIQVDFMGENDCGIPNSEFEISFQTNITYPNNGTNFNCDSLPNCATIQDIQNDITQLESDIASLSGQSTTFSGGTVTGPTNFLNGLSANTFSATTYLGLPLDITVTGGTYSNGTAIFTNNTGGTFSVTGFSTGSSTSITGNYLPLSGGTVSGGTIFTNGLTANTLDNVNRILFNTTASTTHIEGQLHWNNDTKTLEVDTENSNVTVEVGHQNIIRVVNNTGTLISKGTLVYINGGLGNRPTIQIADYSANTANRTIGFVSADIADNNNGYVTTYGLIRNVNTNSYSAGTQLYLGSSGAVTSTEPVAPLRAVRVGIVITQSATVGIIFADVENGFRLDELQNVRISGVTNNQLLSYNSSNQVWQNSSNITLSSITATTISATTYNNLPRDIFSTGATKSGTIATFTNNSGGTFTLTGLTDTFTTGATYNSTNNTFTHTNNTGGTYSIGFSSVSGLTSTGTIQAATISATTYSNIPNQPKLFSKLTADSSITASVAETLLGSILIPAGTITSGDVIQIEFRGKKVGTAGSAIPRIRVNSTTSLSGNTVFSLTQVAANLGLYANKFGIVKSATNTEFGTLGVSDDLGQGSSTATASYNIDWTQNQYVLFSYALNSSADTATMSYLSVLVK